MVYKGVVMEVEKTHIIVLTDDTNYLKLKKKGNIDIGKKIMFIEEDIIRKSNKSLRPLIAIAATIILVIGTIIGQFGIDFIGDFKAYAIVSLDINPSLEFQIDEKEIVKKINSLSKDGREIIDDNMVGMYIEDAVISSIKKAINKQYLNNENNVVLVSDVILDDRAELTTVIENEIFQKVEDDEELQGIDLIYVDSDKEDLEKARENQVSVGKYKVYKIISDKKPEVKVEDIKNKKVSEIVRENEGLTKGEMVKTSKEEKDKKDNKKKDRNKEEDRKKEQEKAKKNKKDKIKEKEEEKEKEKKNKKDQIKKKDKKKLEKYEKEKKNKNKKNKNNEDKKNDDSEDDRDHDDENEKDDD